MAILITVILYGRMIEIYCTVSIAPIPIATMSNREWGSIGTKREAQNDRVRCHREQSRMNVVCDNHAVDQHRIDGLRFTAP